MREVECIDVLVPRAQAPRSQMSSVHDEDEDDNDDNDNDDDGDDGYRRCLSVCFPSHADMDLSWTNHKAKTDLPPFFLYFFVLKSKHGC